MTESPSVSGVVMGTLRKWRATAACLIAVLFSLPAFGQFSSNIQGVVLDATGAGVPNADVSLFSKATNQTRNTKSSDSGVYRFSSLAPGSYEVSAEARGFQKTTLTIQLETAQTAGVNITVAVAGSAQAVNITSEAPPLDTDETRLQTTIRQETLSDLPVQGRNFMGLVAVAPGITGHGAVGGGAPGDAPDNFSTEKTVEASGNGRNQSGNEFTLDGLNITSNILQGTANLSPNPDSVQEMSVQTNTFGVEQGRGSSVQVAITTRSGTNSIHGTGSYFFTNQDLRARTEFTSAYPPFKRHDLAGTLGGPIWKNHTFAFASVEPLRSQTSNATSLRSFESPEFVQWAQSAFPNTIGTKLLGQYPVVNTATTGVAKFARDLFPDCGTATAANIPCTLPVINTGTFQTSPFRNALQYSVRLDHYLGKNDRFYFNMYKVDLDTEDINARKGFYGVNNNNTNAYQANWTHTFSPTLLNEFSYGQIRVQGSSGQTPGIPFRVPDIGINQTTGINATWGPATFIQHNYNWRDVVSWVRGSHTFRFGFEHWAGDDDAQFAGPYERPHFQFLSLLDLVRDQPYEENGVNFNPVTGQVGNGAYRHLLNTNGIFVQDQWKVKPNLTLTLGIRWDDYGNPHPDKNTNMSNVFLGSGSDLNARVQAGVVKPVKGVYNGRLNNNWSPRVGFAWDPTNTGTWRIRGGIGLYHDWIPLGEANRVRQNPPGLITPNFRVGDPTPPIFSLGTSDRPPFGFTFPTIPAGAVDPRGGVVGLRAAAGGIDPNIHADNVVIYQIAVERQLPGRWVASAVYSGSRMFDGLLGTDINRFPGDLLNGTRDLLNPSFGQIWYEFNGNETKYNAGIFSVRRTVGRTQFQASYTFSKVTDFGQAGTRVNRDPGFATPSQYDLQQFEGPADWDVRHRFAFSGAYEFMSPHNGIARAILGGWEIATVGILQTGTPFTVFTTAPFSSGGDYNADGVNYDFPNVPSNPPTSFNRQQYIRGVFTPAFFTAPAPGTLGNEKRNRFRNPNFINIDASMIKNNRIYERVNLQLRFEFFNVLNRVNLQGVHADLNDSQFGRSTGTYDPRIIQLGARLVF